MLPHEPAHQVVELPPGLRVEPGGRLVEEEQLGPPDRADRDVEPTALAAGQASDLLVRLVGEPDGGHQLVGVPRRGTSGVEYGA